MTLHIGTAGWSYPSGPGRWDGVFYPAGLESAAHLTYYARYFNAVEVNTTFYRPVEARIARAWTERVPAEFRFAVKIWQKFTHPKMYEAASGDPWKVRAADYDRFWQGLEPLASAGRLGPILVQFPPSFHPGEAAFDYLDGLLRRLSAAGLRPAVELRQRDWTDGDGIERTVRDLIADAGGTWTRIDEPKFRTSIGDPPAVGTFGYYRFHGRNAAHWWRPERPEERYNYLYSPAEQADLAARVQESARTQADTYVFYNNHFKAKAVANALQLKLTLDEAPATELPPMLLREYPDLAESAGVSVIAALV